MSRVSLVKKAHQAKSLLAYLYAFMGGEVRVWTSDEEVSTSSVTACACDSRSGSAVYHCPGHTGVTISQSVGMALACHLLRSGTLIDTDMTISPQVTDQGENAVLQAVDDRNKWFCEQVSIVDPVDRSEVCKNPRLQPFVEFALYTENQDDYIEYVVHWCIQTVYFFHQVADCMGSLRTIMEANQQLHREYHEFKMERKRQREEAAAEEIVPETPPTEDESVKRPRTQPAQK